MKTSFLCVRLRTYLIVWITSAFFPSPNFIVSCLPCQYHRGLGTGLFPRDNVVKKEQKSIRKWGKQKRKSSLSPRANEQNTSFCLRGHVFWVLPTWKCHRTFQFHLIYWGYWVATTNIHWTLCLLPGLVRVVLGSGCNLKVSISWMTEGGLQGSPNFDFKQEGCATLI